MQSQIDQAEDRVRSAFDVMQKAQEDVSLIKSQNIEAQERGEQPDLDALNAANQTLQQTMNDYRTESAKLEQMMITYQPTTTPAPPAATAAPSAV